MSTEKLPEGWVNTTIENISEKCSQRVPLENEEFIYVDIGSINRELKFIENPQYLYGKNAPSRARKVIKVGDVIVSLTRPNLNAVALVNEKYDDQIASTGFEVIQPIKVQSKYIFGLVRSRHFIDTISGFVQGALYPAAKSRDVQSYEFPLPPLAEQKIIAEKLDTLLAQVDSTKARLEQIPQKLQRFRQAVLAAAVSGRLTQEWREKNKITETSDELLVRWSLMREQKFIEKQLVLLESGKIRKIKNFPLSPLPDMVTGEKLIVPTTWKIVSVSQIADCLDSQRIPVKKENRAISEGLYPYFGANGEVDRVDDFIFDGDYILVTEDETFYGRVKPISYRYTGKCWVNNHVHILSAPTRAANDYLCYALMFYKIIPWLTGTTGRAKLTQGALNVLPIGLPPEEEINEIVRRVEQLFTYADTIEKQVNNALVHVNSLTQSILAKAFRGELTAQWRAENPDLISGENSAAALLETIKAERAASSSKKASRKKK